MRTESGPPWYREAEARRRIVLGYLPWLAGLNLVWETAHVPLYTLWDQAQPGYIAFAVMHCTLGDVLIGGISLLLALSLGRERAIDQWRWPRIAALTVLFGTSYTVFSEWMNVKLLRSWTYAESMPVIELWALEIGLSPLAQWLVIPPLALYLAHKGSIVRVRHEGPRYP